MKKIYKLKNTLEKLDLQKKNYNSLDNLSIPQFINYKMILSKESKINKQLEQAIMQEREINFWYDSNTKSWIDNSKINCRKYCKMEKKAAYKKDLKLYKLGLLNKKPTHPIINKVLSPIGLLFNKKIKPIFKHIYNKIYLFKSQVLPQKFNNLAISTASIGIKGYRHLKSNCRYIRFSITSKNSFKYLKNVMQEANKKVDSAEKSKQFRESLKIENFNSQDINFKNNNSIYSHSHKSPSISITQNNKCGISR